MQASKTVIRVGARVTKKVLIRSEDVKAFGNLIDDHNPIHSDAAAAKAAGFPSPICYGMFPSSLFSGLMATELPGPQTVYLSQNLSFTAPVLIGDEIELVVEILGFKRGSGLIHMSTTAHKVDAETQETIVCIKGDAVGMNKIVEFEGESEWTAKR